MLPFTTNEHLHVPRCCTVLYYAVTLRLRSLLRLFRQRSATGRQPLPALTAAFILLASTLPILPEETGRRGDSGRAGIAFAGEERVTIYKYVDEHGVVHLTNRPCGDGRYRVFGRFRVHDLVRTVGTRGIHSLADKYGKRHGLDPNLVEAVIAVESNYDPTAVSSAGAQGLMQIMPGTQKDLGVEAPFNPDANVEGGVRYLKSLMQRFGDTRLALAAYNAGPERVARCGGIPAIPETQNYVTKVMATYERLSRR